MPKAIEQILLFLLKISLIVLIIYFLFGIFQWITEKEVGLVVQPFETSGIREWSSGKLLSKEDKLDGNSFSALLRFDLQDINDTWSRSIEKKISENLILKDTSSFSIPNLGIKNEGLDYSISNIGSVSLEGSSLHLGNMLLTMKELSGNRASTISCSLQRYNSTVLVVAILDDHYLPDKRIIRIFQAKEILYHNSSMMEQIPDLINDLAYQLSLDISKRRASRTEDLPKSWQAFKYLTQGRDAYIDYQIMNNLNDLHNASNLTIEAIKFEPSWKRSSDMLSRLGFSYLEINEDKRAEDIFLTMPASDFNRSLGLGLVYFKLGNYNESLNEFENATRLNNNSAIAWYNKGVALDRLERYDESEQSYENAVNIKQNYSDAWFSKGCAHYNQGEYDEAIEAYNKAIEANSTCADTWYNKGNVHYLSGKFNESLQAYDKAIELAPNDAKIWYSKGYILLQQEKYGDAIKAFDKSIKFNPSGDAWSDKGDALRLLGKYDEAIQAYDEAIQAYDEAFEVNSTFFYVWAKKGDVLADQNKYDEAIQAYDEALKNDSNNPEAWTNKGKALFKLGKHDEAIKAYDEAIKTNSTYFDAWAKKGDAYIELGKFNEALQGYNMAIELAPNYAEYWLGKGHALDEQKKYDEAIEAYEKSIDINPNNEIVWNSKGIALNEQRKNDEAIKAFDKAIELNSNFTEARSNKGIALISQGKYNEAIEALSAFP